MSGSAAFQRPIESIKRLYVRFRAAAGGAGFVTGHPESSRPAYIESGNGQTAASNWRSVDALFI